MWDPPPTALKACALYALHYLANCTWDFAEGQLAAVKGNTPRASAATAAEPRSSTSNSQVCTGGGGQGGFVDDHMSAMWMRDCRMNGIPTLLSIATAVGALADVVQCIVT